MSNQRQSDTKTRSHFRTDRFFQQDGLWYFNTREGTLEGPYATRKAAEAYLKTFIVLSRLSSNLDMTLQPTEDAPQAPAKGKAGRNTTWDFDPFSSRYRSKLT